MSRSKNIISICLFSFLLFGSVNVIAQTRRSLRFFEQAKEFYMQGNEQEAKENALKSIQADSTHLDAFMLLADIFNRQQNNKEEIWALENIVALSNEYNPLAYRLLVSKYIETGSFEKGLQMLLNLQMNSSVRDSAWITGSITQCYKALSILENKHDIHISRLDSGINTRANEYWPFISADDSTLYFTRLITDEGPFPFERLFYSTLTCEGWRKAEKLSLGNNAEVNEGTISITADGRLIFFTACGRPGGKGSCDIYYMYKMNGQWSQPINAANINTGGWEAQAAVSPHGDRIFWSSNRNGGFGGKDIWEASLKQKPDGKLEFGEPFNVGGNINTRYDDFSPFIHADEQTLYFASEGHLGLGGSDLFMSKFDGEEWGRAVNLGYPINSIHNEDGLVVSPTAHITLMASDRISDSSKSKSLYVLQLPSEFKPRETGYVKGHVFNKLTLEKIDAKIELANLNENVYRTLNADSESGYIAILQKDKSYAFNISSPGFLFYSQRFEYRAGADFHNAQVLDIYLTPVRENENVVLKNVLFEHDSYQLTTESEAELMQIVDFLKLNSKLRIEILGHTDNVGDEQYNLILSENRAKAISNFLLEYIPQRRINFIGYGSTQPVADNKSEEGRKLNRRSEMRIVSID